MLADCRRNAADLISYETFQTVLPKDLVFKYGVAVDMGAHVLAYSTKALANGVQPNTWADMFDLKRFPGRRMMPKDPRGMLEVALLADGVSKDNLYPLDLDRAFRKLNQIKDNTIFFDGPSQSQQLIVDGRPSAYHL